MTTLGLSPKAVESILKNYDWVQIYSRELDKRLIDLEKNKEGVPERRFQQLIKPILESIYDDD